MRETVTSARTVPGLANRRGRPVHVRRRCLDRERAIPPIAVDVAGPASLGLFVTLIMICAAFLAWLRRASA
ncbi:hypothetical protein C7U92_11865 [Bradyrhizobium sp. WBOS7]|uniref:Uncharacterized protein n=1 Tax=Bradyrhizobium betae TaxID=244734 RepID=A0AAE9NAB2_9BRAD|nr:hypothetical protein [Bradyrhizobium sp. WBOS2]MDD1572392.1 hypothetical protein [Bradyrhizobium sp. WBOS1]MDD1577422.1 hypothetical protein [Bradyrhizobium sp. WBOS7]MDD1602663.1 hypothetical protein [Bradyrhizobium sp. WBOS16]UUO34213.1 hypothetical protein DCK84_06245 [Bradyrhizobium sp. WBOS01]UUO40645.1 hypothetical protein DCM75_07670 [Bradyrhizobium sp. WBOS02]UUO52422.1 hypothetical protein DCM79_05115 [Bradyrhizobium sp. WBOS07]UUO64913.1 hypothetical protein DCM83_06565 [Bradyrh